MSRTLHMDDQTVPGIRNHNSKLGSGLQEMESPKMRLIIRVNHDQRQDSNYTIPKILSSAHHFLAPSRHATLLTCSILYNHVDFLLSSSLRKYSGYEPL